MATIPRHIELINYEKKHKTGKLNLGNCGLTFWPEELFELTWLEELVMSNNMKWNEKESKYIVAYKSENIPNTISYIPDSMHKIKDLKILILNGSYSYKWKISKIENLDKLINLQILELGDNLISKIENLDKLINLQVFLLGGNLISKIENLHNLHKLKKLNLGVNHIIKIENLSNQKYLNFLDLSGNKIRKIEGLDKLIDLRILHLDANQISKIENLGSLNSLQRLNLNANRITQIENLDKLAFFKNLEYVGLDNNPIKNYPQETIEAGWQAIKDRWLNENKLVAFNHVKCLLLGNTNVGKSWLLHYLATNTLPKATNTTHGIIYQQLTNLMNNTTIHCWDFGGQEYFHATHKLFFSPNALHVLLWSKIQQQRDEQKPEACFELNYWLRCVEQLSQDDKPYSNEVLVCENKIDLNNYATTLLNQDDYQNQYKNLNLHFTSFSLQQNKRLNGFKELLIERSLTLLKEQPPKYVTYYNQLQQQKKACVTLDDINANNNESFKAALKVFHNMGILLYFHTVLPNKIFVQPQQLLNLLYQNILSNNQQHQLTKGEIEKTIKGNSLKLKINEVISLLKHFDLVFQINENSDVYFIPQYLNEQSAFIDFFKKYQFAQPNIIIKSDSYLMNVVMLKLFAQYGKSVKQNPHSQQQEYLFWKDGMVIEENNMVLMIKFDRTKQCIELYPDVQHNNFSLQKQVVVSIFNIPGNEELKSKDGDFGTRRVIIPSGTWLSTYFTVLISIDGKYYAVYKELAEAIAEGRFQVKVQTIGSAEKQQSKIVSVFDYNKYLPNNQQGKMKKIFISYSKEDVKLVNKFIEHLSALKQDGKVATWYCTELKGGSDWNEEIQEQFNQSDVVCFMISPNFMKTPYIQEHEVGRAFKRREKDENFRIVPIILDFCRWTTEKNNLGTYTALPYTAKPVLDFSNQNMAWYIIEESLRLMIDENESPYTVDEKGILTYTSSAKFPKDVLRIFERIVEGKVDNNSA